MGTHSSMLMSSDSNTLLLSTDSDSAGVALVVANRAGSTSPSNGGSESHPCRRRKNSITGLEVVGGRVVLATQGHHPSGGEMVGAPMEGMGDIVTSSVRNPIAGSGQSVECPF
jgi:hypothetical protein